MSRALAALLLLVALGLPGRPAPAGEESPLAAERAKAAATYLKAMDLAKKMFVKVIITPRWDEESALESQVADSGSYYESAWTDYGMDPSSGRLDHLLELHRSKETAQFVGLLIGPGLVVVGDDGTGYEWKLVEKVEIEDFTGKRWEVEPHSQATHASGIVFKVKGGGGAGGPAQTAYRPDFKFSLTDRVFSATLAQMYEGRENWMIVCAGAILPFDKGETSADRLKYPLGSSPQTAEWASGGVALLFDSEGRPAGVNLGAMELSNSDRAAWDPAAMLAGGTVSYEKIDKAREAARKEALRLAYKVRFEFRVEEEDGDGYGMGWWGGGYGMGEGSEDAECFGLSVGGGKLFIPRMMSVENLRNIDKISVRVGEEWKPAEFTAAFKHVAGMMLETKGLNLGEPKGLYETEGVEMMRPFVYCTVREMLGEVKAFARCVRFTSYYRSYKDRQYPYTGDVPLGALLFDMDGKLAGISINESRDPELSDMVAVSSYGYGYGEGGDIQNLVPFGRLKAAFGKPADWARPTWRPMSKEKSERLVWLGVEFDPINKELAESLKVKAQTRGGEIGLTVATVYPGSPAAKLGIEAQDILLRLEVRGLGDPLPLMSSYAAEMAEQWASISQYMGQMATQEFGARTWKPRRNFLTELMTSAGPGHQAEIVYLSYREKKLKKGSFKLDYGPVDYDSAEKHKDEKLGLSVKPLTYEARLALGLTPEAPGVVISKIEDGSAAQLARLSPYMLVTRVQGQPVKGLDEFKAAIAALRKEGQEKVKLQVAVMGRSRFADLKLGGEEDVFEDKDGVEEAITDIPGLGE